jgi:hypothetical protein
MPTPPNAPLDPKLGTNPDDVGVGQSGYTAGRPQQDPSLDTHAKNQVKRRDDGEHASKPTELKPRDPKRRS